LETLVSPLSLLKYFAKLSDLIVTDLDLLTPSLSLLPNLRKFNYQAHHVGPKSLCLNILLLLFNTNASLSNLHTISIRLEHIRTETEEDALALVQSPLWQTTDALLAGPHFSALRKFFVALKFTLPVRPDDQSWPEDFFDLNSGAPGFLNRSLIEEDWNRIRSAPSFGNTVLGILQACFVSVKHSRAINTSYKVEESCYALNGQV
jgi:hypothetical protein